MTISYSNRKYSSCFVFRIKRQIFFQYKSASLTHWIVQICPFGKHESETLYPVKEANDVFNLSLQWLGLLCLNYILLLIHLVLEVRWSVWSYLVRSMWTIISKLNVEPFNDSHVVFLGLSNEILYKMPLWTDILW